VCLYPVGFGYRIMVCGIVSSVFSCGLRFVVSLVSICEVEAVAVWFPLGRVCVGYYCLCYVFGGRLGLGSLVVGLAWGIRRFVCLDCCFGGCGGLAMFLVRFVEFSVFLFFVLDLFRVVLYPRRCRIYYVVRGPPY
jgi:hypothetical protein